MRVQVMVMVVGGGGCSLIRQLCMVQSGLHQHLLLVVHCQQVLVGLAGMR